MSISLPSTEVSAEAWRGAYVDAGFFMSQADLERAAAVVAREAVQSVIRRSEYEAIKILAWRFRFGTHIVALSPRRGEQHAIYISAEEVVHREETSGRVVSDTWVLFLMRYPNWRALQWPEDCAHADAIVRRARCRLGMVEESGVVRGGSDQFVRSCYAGDDVGTNAANPATTLAKLATGGAAAGAMASTPYAITSSTVYAMGFLPVGTASVFSGGVVVAGAAAGAAAGALVVAPLLWSLTKRATEASMRRLALGIINETSEPLRVQAFALDDSFCLMPVCGMGGSADAEVQSGQLIELDPATEAENFRIVVSSASAYVYFTRGRLRAAVRRGGVYSIRSLGAVVDGAPNIEIAQIPRFLLPAYSPG